MKALGIEIFGHRKKIMQETEALISELSVSERGDNSTESQKTLSMTMSDEFSSEIDLNEKENAEYMILNLILCGEESLTLEARIKITNPFEKVLRKICQITDIKPSNIVILTKEKEKLTETEWLNLIKTNQSKELYLYIEKINADILSKKERKVFNTLSNCCFVINKKGIVIFINRSVKKTLGFSSLELIGENISKIIPDEHASKHDQYLERYLKTGKKTVLDKGREVKVKLNNGALQDAWLSVVENKNKSGRHTFTGNLHLLEKEVRDESTHSSYLILDALKESILVINTQHTITFANRAAEKLLGYSVKEYLGQNINMMMPEPYHSLHGKIYQHIKKIYNFFFFFASWLH